MKKIFLLILGLMLTIQTGCAEQKKYMEKFDLWADDFFSNLCKECQEKRAREKEARQSTVENKTLPPLIRATRDGNRELVRKLLASGEPVDPAENEASSALVEASKNGYVDIAKLLIAHGADVNKRAPIITAAAYGHREIIMLLVRKGARVNAEESGTGRTALMAAARRDHRDIVKFLLDHGAKISIQDNKGRTAYEYCNSAKMRELLAQYGASHSKVQKLERIEKIER